MDGLSLYRPVSLVTSLNSETSNDDQDPLWIKQILQQDSNINNDFESEKLSEIEEEEQRLQKSDSSYLLNINVKDNIVHVSRPSPPSEDVVAQLDKNLVTQAKQSEKLNSFKGSTDVMLNSGWDKTSSFVPEIDGEDPCYEDLR